jgi:hypothetical protein
MINFLFNYNYFTCFPYRFLYDIISYVKMNQFSHQLQNLILDKVDFSGCHAKHCYEFLS